MGMRVMSRQSTSMVYHRAECRYVKQIHEKNRVKAEWEDAEWKGYRPCRCCDGTSFLYNLELEEIDLFSRQHNLDVDLKNYKVYVRTDVGCWKIIYKRSMQKFILLHRNYVKGHIGLDEVENAPYHRQGDMADSGSIMKYLKYIQKHDAFKKKMPTDLSQMPKDTKSQKAYYRSARRREEKRNARRLDRLFLMVEQKEGIKRLSLA